MENVKYYLQITIVQWRRQDFFGGGGTPRPLKGYQAPPAEGSGAKAPGR